MGVAGAAYGASKALEEILADQMFKAKLQQQQQMEQARLQLDQQRVRLDQDREARRVKNEDRAIKETDAADLVAGLREQFDPNSSLDPEVSDDAFAQVQGTTQASRVREIPTLAARATDPSMAGSISQTPEVGVRRIAPTAEQQGQRRLVDVRRRVAPGLAGDAATRRNARATLFEETGQTGPDLGDTPEEADAKRAQALQDDIALRRATVTSGKPRIDIRNVSERGPGGEPGTRVITFNDGTIVSSQWFPGNPTGGERGRMADAETMRTSLESLNALFKPEYVGPVAGRMGTLGQTIPGVPVDEDRAQFYAATSAVRNSVIKAITGAQMSEPEGRRIMTQIPSENDKPEVWQSKYIQSIANVSRLEDALARRQGTPASPAPIAEMPDVDAEIAKIRAQRKPQR